MKNQEAKLAWTFSTLLLRDLGEDTLTKVARLNLVETENFCHSHDYIDTNMVMAEAFKQVTETEVDLDSSSDISLWNSSWNLAITNNFYLLPLKEEAKKYKQQANWRGFDDEILT